MENVKKAMKLCDIEQRDQFSQYYAENNLYTTQDKINHLIAAMKIRAVKYEEDETEDEKLIGLQETALCGVWRALC